MKLKLPQSTYFGRKIPKTKFYEKLQAGSNLKELFVEQVESVVWSHNLSPRTIRLEAADGIEEIQIFEIELRQRSCSTEILKAIDRAIPYPILYVLRYEEESKWAIAYKERSGSNENRSVVRSYHETSWRKDSADGDEEAAFEVLQGLDLKAVYERIVRSVVLAGSASGSGGEDDEPGMPTAEAGNADAAIDGLALEALLERQANIEALQRYCAKLEAKIGREKQFNRKVELNMELQRKRKELKELQCETMPERG